MKKNFKLFAYFGTDRGAKLQLNNKLFKVTFDCIA